MAPPCREMLEKLIDIGDSLLKCLSSVNQLLNLLDKLEYLLSTVDQGPDRTVKDALLPSMKALISNELLRHSDEDVKISVTSCITEITRITAPDAPYHDEQMKEIFKLTVAAFEKLSHVSGHCYEKALLILDNVARVRSCLVMMDLECDDLIIEMFQHFLRVIRSNHPHTVILAMETIMTMVLDESEEISSDLLRPLLDSVRKENQTISPISWALGDKVLTNCADKVQPYLTRTVQSTGRALDAYAQIVVSICQRRSETLEHDHSNGSRNPLVTKGLERDMTCVRDVAQIMDDEKSNKRNASASTMGGEIVKKEGSKRQLNSDFNKNSTRNNEKPNLKIGNLESGGTPKSETELDTLPKKRGRKPNSLLNPEEGYDHTWIYIGRKSANPVQSRKEHNSGCDFPPSESPASRKDKLPSEPENMGEIFQPKTEKTTKPAQSRKVGDSITDLPPSKNSTSPKDKLLSEPENVGQLSQPKTEKNKKPTQSRRACDSGIDLSPSENPAFRNDKLLSKPRNMSEGCEVQVSPPKTDENFDAAHPSTNHSIPDRRRPKRGRPKKKSITNNQDVNLKSISMLKEDHLIAQLEENSLEPPSLKLKKDFEVIKDAEVKAQAPLRKIKLTVKTDEKTAVVPESTVGKMESKSSCEDEKKLKSAMNIEAANIEEGRSLTQTDVKKRRRLNTAPNKDLNESSIIKELITESATKTLKGIEETSQTRPKRKGTAVSVEASETHESNNPLVGSRIKVWWPMDKMFYEGSVDSYDSVKGKHKIMYADGDVEVLNLKKQRWELITDHVSPDAEQGIDLQQLEVASNKADKRKEISELESAKANANSHPRRGRASGRITKSISAKSAGKSMDNSALDEPVVADKSVVDPPRTDNGKESAGKSKTKRLKIV